MWPSVAVPVPESRVSAANTYTKATQRNDDDGGGRRFGEVKSSVLGSPTLGP